MGSEVIFTEYPDRLEIYYVRHADTCGTRLEGRPECDIDISELGEKQAALLGERFAGKHFDAVLSSPMVRAVKTAAAVCEKLEGKPVIEIVPEFIENGTMPEYGTCDIDYLRRYWPDIKMCEDRIVSGTIKTGNDRENDRRAKALVAYLRSRFTYGQKIIVFCHGSFGNHFIPAAVEMGKGNYILSISNTSVSKIKYTTDGKQRLSFCNDISHLRPLMPEYEFDT